MLNPLTVEVKRNGLGRLQFTVQGEDKILSSEDIIFIPDMLKPGTVRGVSRVEALKENLGYAIALDKFAQDFFGSGSQLAGVIEFPGNLTGEQAQDLANGFDSRHRIRSGRGHRTGVLTGGAKFVQTQSDPERSMLVESKNQAIADVARAFSIPPHLLALPGTNTYASVEQNNLAWVTHGLRPIIEKLESSMTPLMARTPGGENAFVKFNFNGLLRADSTSRAQFYSTGIQAGYFAINDIRRWEDLRVYDDPAADRPRVPLANVNLDAADLIADEKRVKMAQALVLSGYDPAEALMAVGLDPIRHTGLASTQLQPVAQVDPDNPTAVYEVE